MLYQHAKHRTAPSRFIANDRGHLNERQDRHPGRNPFGNFVGNWDTPCHHPGNHVDTVVNRSKAGIQYLQKQRELYNAAISANEAKNDKRTAEAVRNSINCLLVCSSLCAPSRFPFINQSAGRCIYRL
ncbi:unnamed protein product [Dibothriocephalus latus]|uniref:Cilia- and flagella-associated protein 126 n=1 Tax=Dibothriocephalus latus TaxID=60516 RepID=A0A3P6R9W5_DIBLA|nr:unnamed protein product [Dibothriocephalus latus]